jgi:hypothetical protein
MSAFIVAKPCIARIVSFLSKCSNSRGMDSCIVEGIGYNLPDAMLLLDERKLANDMMAMNYAAYYARYKGERSAPETFAARDFPAMQKLDPVVVYKSLVCFLYQCAEGDVREQQLYKTLKKVEHRLAYHIISETKEFKEAPWGK